MAMTNRTSRLEELIDTYEHLIKDLAPTEEKLKSELSDVRLQILERSRVRTSFTGDPLKDVTIFKFGREFRKNYEQLVHLQDMLKKAEGQFILVHDRSYNLLVNELDETDRCYIPHHVAALGVIDSSPLEAGYEYEIAGDKYYLKLRFRDGAYIRELDEKDHGKLDKWLNIIPTFRGREEAYTEKTESLMLVEAMKDYTSSEDYIRDLYTGRGRETKKVTKKPYWRIAADKFDASKITIGSDPAIEIFEKQDFPSIKDKVFALYIGNDEVMKRLGLDLRELNTLQKVYDVLISARRTNRAASLIF